MTLPFSDSTKGIFNMMQNGTAFSTSVLGDIGGMADRMTAAATQMSTLGIPEIGQQVTDMVAGPITSLMGHVTNQISDLPKNLGVANSFMGMANNLGISAGSDGSVGGCNALGDFFGSVMGGAQSVIGAVGAVMTSIESAIASVTGAIDAVVGTINAAIATLQNTMNQITGMIQNEIAKMTAAIQQLGYMAGALVLSTLFGSSQCAQQLISQAGSLGLLKHLG